MISSLLSFEIQEFIALNIDANISKLALQKNPFPEIPWVEILTQISAKSKAKEKLPTWYAHQNIMYPNKISVEQTSSEKTAYYKSNLVSGESLIDLTGGFGVDDYYFSKKINQVYHCELNRELSEIVVHNFEVLNQKNITCLQGDSFETLKKLNQKFDWIYIDPSRRSDTKGKVFMLKDCLPNVPKLLEDYFKFSNKILIKTAPILDITSGLNELQNVKTIHIIAINNEVKELLWEIEQNYKDAITIKTINFNKEKEDVFNFILNSEIENKKYTLPKKYIYEPNAALLKSGAFELIANHFKIEKLHQHSHLYTSNEIIDFPGRIFEIKNRFEYNKNEMKEFLENTKANITTRNFPETVENIRKKWKISDGGNSYVFFTTDANNYKIVLICAKI
ncbi:SAM-dependent methyltransferase [Flavobacterium psychrophilum]|uniref:THUMP-like domain-containing protein n=1 Tax=Flavobacterium psychrophilum TaxID=96345 RepID=UPI000743661B|nr:SAM-dependent methyltransferase [Flavobacterium psychrophilum]KUM16291.1 SAM-dependent methyltransferase [Flavobacterium psychrophilum]